MNAKQFNKHMSEFLLSDPIFDGVPKFSIGLTSDDSTQTVIPLKDLPELFLTLPQKHPTNNQNYWLGHNLHY